MRMESAIPHLSHATPLPHGKRRARLKTAAWDFCSCESKWLEQKSLEPMKCLEPKWFVKPKWLVGPKWFFEAKLFVELQWLVEPKRLVGQHTSVGGLGKEQAIA